MQRTHLRGGGTASGDAPASDAIEDVRERVDAARRVVSTCASSCSMIFSKSSCHFCADRRCGRTHEEGQSATVRPANKHRASSAHATLSGGGRTERVRPVGERSEPRRAGSQPPPEEDILS